MKKLVCFAVWMMVISAAFGQASKSQVVGNWKLQDFSMSPDPMEMMIGMMPEDKVAEAKAGYEAAMTEMKAKSHFSFKSDGTYEISMAVPGQPAPQVSKGTWYVTADGRQLISKEEGKEEEDKITIKSATTTTLKLVQVESEAGQTMTVTMTLKKQ